METKDRIYQVDDSQKIFGSMLVYIQHSNDDISAHRVSVTEKTDCLRLAHKMLAEGKFNREIEKGEREMKRLTSAQRLEAAQELASYIQAGGDAASFMAQFPPEDAVLINDQAFSVLRLQRGCGPEIYSVQQADLDCLSFLARCSSEFVQAHKEMGQGLLRAFDAYIEAQEEEPNHDD